MSSNVCCHLFRMSYEDQLTIPIPRWLPVFDLFEADIHHWSIIDDIENGITLNEVVDTALWTSYDSRTIWLPRCSYLRWPTKGASSNDRRTRISDGAQLQRQVRMAAPLSNYTLRRSLMLPIELGFIVIIYT